jgi:selenophosphate synthetase-related protein
MAVDLRGQFEEPYPFWNASVGAPTERLRADLELLPTLAEQGWCDAAKDISMAGVLGTALMLLECSGVGARIDLNAIPRPQALDGREEFERWLLAFPSFGFLLSVREANVDEVIARFNARSLACAVIGTIDGSRRAIVEQGSDSAVLWDFHNLAFIGANPHDSRTHNDRASRNMQQR